MKNKTTFKTLFAGIAILVLTTSLSSCQKDDVIISGSANIKIVNASPSSSPQGFYLANSTVIQSGLSFGNTSDYIVANSGTNLSAQFKTNSSTAPIASGNLDLDNGKYYTIFLAGEGPSARVKVYLDDNSAPQSGKVKVRFVHLSDAAAANIDVKSSSGENLVVNLARENSSNYISIDPGILSLQVFAAGQTTSLGNFELAAFSANKIYTVYITGATANSISVHQVAQ